MLLFAAQPPTAVMHTRGQTAVACGAELLSAAGEDEPSWASPHLQRQVSGHQMVNFLVIKL